MILAEASVGLLPVLIAIALVSVFYGARIAWGLFKAAQTRKVLAFFLARRHELQAARLRAVTSLDEQRAREVEAEAIAVFYDWELSE